MHASKGFNVTENLEKICALVSVSVRVPSCDGDGSDADATPHMKDAMFTRSSHLACCLLQCLGRKRIGYGGPCT